MNKELKISVVVPIYNVEPYLRKCLDSIVNQTYKNLEIILIDDGSPDKCGSICDEYAKMDSRIIVIHKENAGLCAARNDGIQKAEGEWIAFVDSDDWLETDYYERIVASLSNKNVDVFCLNKVIMEYKSNTKIKTTFDKQSFFYSSHAEMEQLMIKVLLPGDKKTSTLGGCWEKIYRTSFLKDKYLFFDTSCMAWEDLWFNFQVFDKANKVAGHALAGYHYRMVENSITKGFNPQKIEIGYDFLTKLHSYLEDRKISNEMQQALDVRAIEVVINSLNAYQFHPKYLENTKTQAKQIREIIRRPYFQQAIHSGCNDGFSWRMLVWKYFLRLPCVWPLQVSKKAKRKIKNIWNGKGH